MFILAEQTIESSNHIPYLRAVQSAEYSNKFYKSEKNIFLKHHCVIVILLVFFSMNEFRHYHCAFIKN